MQILDNYYEPSPLARAIEPNYKGSGFKLSPGEQSSIVADSTQGHSTQDHSTQNNEQAALPLHFYLQNLHYQRLNHSINSASKEKRKQKEQQ